MDSKNIILGVIDVIGIEFLLIVVVYFEFFYELMYVNGIENN